jgi:hypothetical protein
MIDSTAGAAGKRPLGVFAVVDRENRPSIWIRVGSAFPNRDGSTNLMLDAFPIGTNKLQIREVRWEERQPAAGAHAAEAAEVLP